MADMISTLPDDILCHILSFLQTKQCVVTSILSKRWNHLWLSVPTLRFDEGYKTVKDPIISVKFKDFVNSVLHQRDATLPIKSFDLNVSYCYDLPCPIISITKWVNFCVQQRVEYLCLHLYRWARFPELPVTIFTCKTLVVLKLFHFTVMKEGFSDSSVVLPSLKTLHLKFIWFPKLQDFTMFLSRCPILEDLLISAVFFDYNESRNCIGWNNFYLSNLIRANINCANDYFLLKTVHSTLSLRLEIDQVDYPNDFIASFHNLTQLDLIPFRRYSCKFLVKFLNQCPKLQKLDLHQAYKKETWTTRKDDKQNLEDLIAVPQCLSLHLTTCNLFNLGQQDELIVAQYILKSASILQTMKIWKRGHSKNERIISSYPRASSICKLQFMYLL